MKRIAIVAALVAAVLAGATGCPCRGESCVIPPSNTVTVSSTP
jgi:hypothetical protein